MRLETTDISLPFREGDSLEVNGRGSAGTVMLVCLCVYVVELYVGYWYVYDMGVCARDSSKNTGSRDRVEKNNALPIRFGVLY